MPTDTEMLEWILKTCLIEIPQENGVILIEHPFRARGSTREAITKAMAASADDDGEEG